jgi:hypothetical protein
VPVKHLRALAPKHHDMLANKPSEGFWNSGSLAHGGQARVINNTAGCTGPWLAIFMDEEIPTLDWEPMPSTWVANGLVRLVVAKGTLIPSWEYTPRAQKGSTQAQNERPSAPKRQRLDDSAGQAYRNGQDVVNFPQNMPCMPAMWPGAMSSAPSVLQGANAMGLPQGEEQMPSVVKPGGPIGASLGGGTGLPISAGFTLPQGANGHGVARGQAVPMAMACPSWLPQHGNATCSMPNSFCMANPLPTQPVPLPASSNRFSEMQQQQQQQQQQQHQYHQNHHHQQQQQQGQELLAFPTPTFRSAPCVASLLNNGTSGMSDLGNSGRLATTNYM